MADYKRLYNTMKQMLDKYQNEIVPELRKEIEKIAKERDAMIESLRKSKACCVCTNRNTRDPNKNAYDITAKCIRCVCGESQFEWRGLCDENSEAKE